MRRRQLVFAAIGVVFALQAASIVSTVLLSDAGTPQLEVGLCVAGTLCLGLLDLLVARRLQASLVAMEWIYAAQRQQRLARLLQDYDQQVQRERAQAAELGRAIERELSGARQALSAGDWQTTGDRLRTSLSLAQSLPAHADNVTVAAVLANKERQYAEQGVRLDARIALPQELPLDDAYLAALFFNLLDNALHECTILQEKDHTVAPQVSVRAFVQAGQLLVEARNPCRSGAARRRRLAMRQGKAQPIHGLGTGIVESIALRHGGIARFEERGGSFVATVMIPLSQA